MFIAPKNWWGFDIRQTPLRARHAHIPGQVSGATALYATPALAMADVPTFIAACSSLESPSTHAAAAAYLESLRGSPSTSLPLSRAVLESSPVLLGPRHGSPPVVATP